jgi:hypothetical protein
MKCPLCNSNRAHRSSRCRVGLLRWLRWALTTVRCSDCGHRYVWPTILLGPLAPQPTRRYPAETLLNQPTPSPHFTRHHRAATAIRPPHAAEPLLAALARQNATERAELIGFLTLLPTSDGLLPVARPAESTVPSARDNG